LNTASLTIFLLKLKPKESHEQPPGDNSNRIGTLSLFSLNISERNRLAFSLISKSVIVTFILTHKRNFSIIFPEKKVFITITGMNETSPNHTLSILKRSWKTCP